MKQIINRELAEELGISTTTAIGQMVACVVEERKVFSRIYTLKGMITALNAGAEYIGNDRSRLVDWEEEERWFLWQYKHHWSLEHYPSNKTLAGFQGCSDRPPLLDRMKSYPEDYTELSKAEANYILAKPDGEGWELRRLKSGDHYKTHSGMTKISGGVQVDQDTINGLRWRKKPAVPWTMEDVPTVCWIRRIGEERRRAVIDVCSSTVAVRGQVLPYKILAKNYEWSTYLKTWRPCTKEQ